MKMIDGRWTMSWLLAVWAVAVWLASGCLVQAQTLTSVAASNVTAWSAALHGSYGGLATGRSYEVFFYYGQTDAGTNHIGWSNSSSGATIAPADTNEAAGAYSRTVVELTAGTQYWYRAAAYDLDTFDLLMATQSLTFTTRGASPTSMPVVSFMTVVVDTNGVLHFPTNFFEANGIVPTSGVAQLLQRLESNETAVAATAEAALPKAGGVSTGSYELQNTSGGVNSTNTITLQPTVGGGSFRNRGYAQIGSILAADMGYGWVRLGVGTNSSMIYRGSDPWFNFSNQSLTNIDTIVANRIIGSLNAADLTNGSVLGFASLSGNDNFGAGTITANTFVAGTRLSISNSGADTVINYTGFGNLTIMRGSSTAAVFTGSAVMLPNSSLSTMSVTATNGHSYFGSISGNANGAGGPITNIGLNSLRIGNNYTGGVMRLVTTDGVTFFLQ